jgi:outer membrane protein OmpA-like peptidoglycan-associated protein
VAVGLALVAGGAALVGFAMYTQVERSESAVADAAAQAAQARTERDRANASASAASASARAAARAIAAAGANPAPPRGAADAGASADAGSDAGVDAGPDAGADAASAADAGAAAPTGAADVFHFAKGGILLPKEELARLVALGREIRRSDRTMVTIEGFGDEVGTDEKAVTLGRRRATVVRQVFGDIGFDGDRMTLATPGTTDPSVLSSVRIRTNPPMPEVKAP